jgi:hypothetical protein
MRRRREFITLLGGAPEEVRDVRSVGQETTGLDKIALLEDRRQPGVTRKRYDARSVSHNKCIDHNVKCVRIGLERFEGGSDILRSPDFEWRDFDAERASRGLDLAHLYHGRGIANIY